jgi:hypothetical protein
MTLKDHSIDPARGQTPMKTSKIKKQRTSLFKPSIISSSKLNARGTPTTSSTIGVSNEKSKRIKGRNSVIHQPNIGLYRLAKLGTLVMFIIKRRCSKKATKLNGQSYDL